MKPPHHLRQLNHRHHHRSSDTQEDLHSPRKGFWWSHVGWILSDKYKETDYAAIKDFATPFSFQDGSDPTIPAGEDQIVALLKCGILISADQGFASMEFVDGLVFSAIAAAIFMATKFKMLATEPR